MYRRKTKWSLRGLFRAIVLFIKTRLRAKIRNTLKYYGLMNQRKSSRYDVHYPRRLKPCQPKASYEDTLTFFNYRNRKGVMRLAGLYLHERGMEPSFGREHINFTRPSQISRAELLDSLTEFLTMNGVTISGKELEGG